MKYEVVKFWRTHCFELCYDIEEFDTLAQAKEYFYDLYDKTKKQYDIKNTKIEQGVYDEILRFEYQYEYENEEYVEYDDSFAIICFIRKVEC